MCMHYTWQVVACFATILNETYLRLEEGNLEGM